VCTSYCVIYSIRGYFSVHVLLCDIFYTRVFQCACDENVWNVLLSRVNSVLDDTAQETLKHTRVSQMKTVKLR
jgi:hypothetical protein